MDKRQHRRRSLAQNFLKDAALVRRLVSTAAIADDDTVYEIGPGRGIITAELARVAIRVIAIEKDPQLVRTLRERFRERNNVEVVEGDFLRHNLHELGPYKIFANIPYNITAEIVRKILFSRPQPVEAFLIMQREPARKFAGNPVESLFSLLAKPYWDFRIVANLKRTDFYPVPDVESVLLRIRRRRRLPSLAGNGCRFPACTCESFTAADAQPYRDFVRYGFGSWKRDLRHAYKKVFTYEQWKRLSRDLGFPLNATPTELSFEQWLGLYHAHKHLNAQ